MKKINLLGLILLCTFFAYGQKKIKLSELKKGDRFKFSISSDTCTVQDTAFNLVTYTSKTYKWPQSSRPFKANKKVWVCK